MLTRRLIHAIAGLIVVGCCAVAGRPVTAQPWVPPRDQHAWGRFPVGSWKRVQVTNTTYEPPGRVQSKTTTVTRSELESVGAEGFTLRVELTVEVGGKRFEAQPKRIQQHFSPRPNDSTRTGTREVTIGEETFNADVHEWKIRSDDTTVSNILYVTPVFPPYVLKRHAKAVRGEPPMVEYETWVEVTQLNEWARVQGEKKRVWRVRTIHQRDGQKSTVDEIHCAEVPGGVISHQSESRDKMGKVVQTSTLKLLEYHVESPSAESSVGHGRLFPRQHRHHP